ncbi:DUF3108 domain-containing protein [Maritimibacter sp. 55A14]|uniref:DUF3108 domain-containing protein n=1 Tax=Maritimibacter sp. 55A14 TaxID=2174844 RepID=UPI000D60A4D8|nr:DUF3108 domain-containing protein [Maritimibacter sp. 55A14]PWE32021.1 DUF3108 domain-containing protein [Maritimibacter sp. 55A14]
MAPVSRLKYGLNALLVLLCLPVAAVADARRDSAVFDVYLRGIRAGTLSFSGVTEGHSYAASGKVETGGILALFVDARYDASVRGRVTRRGLVPGRYTESADTGSRVSEAEIEYRHGVPQVKKYNPPRKSSKGTVEPATQGGTLDPMSVIYLGLRTVNGDELCKLDEPVFDGKRRSRVTLSGPVEKDGQIICNGLYRRIAGFSEKEMAKRQRYPFRLEYIRQPDDRYQVQELVLTTDVGIGRLIRR